MTQLLLWGDYSEYQNIRRYEGIFYRLNFSGNLVQISCVDIVEGTVDAKLALMPELSRQSALEAVEERRASELSCEEDLKQRAERYAKRRNFHRVGFVLPSSLSNGLSGATSLATFLIMILGASAVGTEYGWGTMRTALTRGVSRWQFLGAKGLSLLLIAGAGLVFVGLSVVVSSLIYASLTSGGGGALADSGQGSTAVLMFAKAVYGLLPYLIVALFLSVLTASSSMGIAISLAYYFVEAILVRILGGLFDWFNNVSDLLLGPNVIAWMTEAEVQATGGDAALFALKDLPGQLHSFLVVTAYIAVLGGAAVWIMGRRDIAGARGE